jgi:hypothetical protein
MKSLFLAGALILGTLTIAPQQAKAYDNPLEEGLLCGAGVAATIGIIGHLTGQETDSRQRWMRNGGGGAGLACGIAADQRNKNDRIYERRMKRYERRDGGKFYVYPGESVKIETTTTTSRSVSYGSKSRMRTLD